MKKVLLTLMCMAAMMAASTSLKAQEVTITIMPGWNWISVPLMDTLDFETALGSFTPAQGDMIKSQWSNASYVNGQWRGQISQFYPGYGYKYYSNRVMPTTVTFQAQQPAPQVVVTTSEPTEITTNSAVCGGNVVSANGDYVHVILKGICWGLNPNPTFNDNYIDAGNGFGSFALTLTELLPGNIYYLRAFAATATETFFGNEITILTQTWLNGSLPGAFSINADQQVYFSQGNLQYQASTHTWRFAENQYDCIGDANSNISQTYNGWIDLFGWGTSGFNHGANCYQPWSTSTNDSDYYAYGNWLNNLNNQTGQADWGYNPISNGGNIVNLWYTLTSEEWRYVFNVRTTASGIRHAKANVNGVDGMILLPDDWNASTYSLNNTNSYYASFSSNILTVSQWTIIENAGAVFLPIAGKRAGTIMLGYSYSGCGEYWSATSYDSNIVWYVYFDDNDFSYGRGSNRCWGRSVRLVRNAE